MLTLIRRTARIALVAGVVALPATAWSQDARWSLEVRGTVINPLSGDGTLRAPDRASAAGDPEADFELAIVPELELGVRVAERFSLALAVAMANFDVKAHVPAGGTVPLGDVDSLWISLAGLFDVAEWNESTLRIGPVVANADFEKIDITSAAAAEGVRRAPVDDDTLFGVMARLDTDLGAAGRWYFTSNVRLLFGGPDMEIFTFGSGSEPFASGSVDLDPLVVSVGFGYRY